MKDWSLYVSQYVTDCDIQVLRDTWDNRAINVSYTKEGLLNTTSSSTGTLICYRDAKLQLNDGKLEKTGDLRPNPNVYITKFKPKTFNQKRLNNMEIAMINKALRMLYTNYSIS
jgi:hypothetical protein